MQRVMDIPIWCILQMTDIPVEILTDRDGKKCSGRLRTEALAQYCKGYEPSRQGLPTGRFYTEVFFREKGVHFVAISNGVDRISTPAANSPLF